MSDMSVDGALRARRFGGPGTVWNNPIDTIRLALPRRPTMRPGECRRSSYCQASPNTINPLALAKFSFHHRVYSPRTVKNSPVPFICRERTCHRDTAIKTVNERLTENGHHRVPLKDACSARAMPRVTCCLVKVGTGKGSDTYIIVYI